jgi:hypothetical protein
VIFDALDKEASGLRLAKIVREELILCEEVHFVGGRPAIDTVLRRARLSGRVEIKDEVPDFFADVLAENGDILQTVSLDRGSYGALKNHWMRCRIDRMLTP